MRGRVLRQYFLFLGSVSEFPGEVLRIKLPSLPSGIGLLLEAGLPLADRCLWLEETLPQSPFLGNFSQMIIHFNGSIFTPAFNKALRYHFLKYAIKIE